MSKPPAFISDRTESQEGVPAQQDDLLTLRVAAKLAGLSYSSLHNLTQKRLIPHYRLSGSGKRGKVMLRRSDLFRWIESQRIEADEPLPPAPKPIPLKQLKA